VNYLHLHLADDQRYTLPSRAFPALNDSAECYTEEQIAYLNEYAAARGVKLVPEIECPGHAAILNAHYPDVFGIRQDSEGEALFTELGVKVDSRSLINAGSETALEGVKTLFHEVCELFPDAPYIHIGGDEAAIKLWNTCADTRAYMKRMGITDVYELYSEYVGRVPDYILSLGRTPMVWEGFPALGAERIDRRTVVIAWESHYHLAPDLLKAGFQIINASWQPLYLVPSLTRRWDFRDILAWNVHEWQHWWEHSAATGHPIHVEPTENVLGSILCSWEMTYEQEIARVMENLMAMSERVWTVERRLSDAAYKSAFAHVYALAANVLEKGSGRKF
jgi:hexosaminidase